MRSLVIGVGNRHRGDDGAGLLAAQLLRERTGDALTVVDCSREATILLDQWQGYTEVLLIDASASGAVPGTIRRLDASHRELPLGLLRRSTSTHAFGVAEAIELARALGQLPPRVIVYAIEGASFEAGGARSEVVENAVTITAALIADELASGSSLSSPPLGGPSPGPQGKTKAQEIK